MALAVLKFMTFLIIGISSNQSFITVKLVSIRWATMPMSLEAMEKEWKNVLDKELNVSKQVEKYRKKYPKAERSYLNTVIRLEYEKKRLMVLKKFDKREEYSYLKRLERELGRVFFSKEGLLKRKTSNGRGSVSSQRFSVFQKDLDDIRHINASKDSIEAFYELRSLTKTWPEIYEKLEKDFDAAEFGLNFETSLRQRGSSLYDDTHFKVSFRVDVENLIAKVSALLHGEFERLHGDKEK